MHKKPKTKSIHTQPVTEEMMGRGPPIKIPVNIGEVQLKKLKNQSELFKELCKKYGIEIFNSRINGIVENRIRRPVFEKTKNETIAARASREFLMARAEKEKHEYHEKLLKLINEKKIDLKKISDDRGHLIKNWDEVLENENIKGGIILELRTIFRELKSIEEEIDRYESIKKRD